MLPRLPGGEVLPNHHTEFVVTLTFQDHGERVSVHTQLVPHQSELPRRGALRVLQESQAVRMASTFKLAVHLNYKERIVSRLDPLTFEECGHPAIPSITTSLVIREAGFGRVSIQSYQIPVEEELSPEVRALVHENSLAVRIANELLDFAHAQLGGKFAC